ncbi:hypothetical protein EJ08DRAFT_701426 [Tothia fuscella]|uniref:Uncharacterized protein n=1 Tax=Tothia fuscella TaxID=1048955 RepID=A0A9P4NI88_9PEZI|nr:hypothetical protein EJ08DRAFT_701426 [Tothia fuscella]
MNCVAMNSPTFSPSFPGDETSSNSLGFSEYTYEKNLPADKDKLKDEGDGATYSVVGETRRSWEQRPWEVKNTVPSFIHAKVSFFALDSKNDRALWIPIPTNFHDLVQILKDHSVMPRFYKIPHVMGFPEFAGYPWMHRGPEHVDAESFRRSMWEDQRMFHRIVFASYRTGRAPLCAPDYFYLSSEGRKMELCHLFRARHQIVDIEWESMIETKKPGDHVDWTPFCADIRSHLPMAEFLFEPPEVWGKSWFARTVTETAEAILVRAEVVDIVKAAGYEITAKKGWFGKQSWSLADGEVIRRVAFAHWIEWRERSERDLERLGSQLVEY